MSLPASVRNFFVRPPFSGALIIAAVSGGSDSTALLLALDALRRDGVVRLHCGHVNHHLRAADSAGDEDFVRTLCARLEIPFTALDGRLDPEQVRVRGIEGAARTSRYALLQDLRKRLNAEFIATAHQQDDQAETVLMRLVSGGGLAALRGIHPVRNDGIVRPMLEVSRADVDAFLAQNGVVARVDASNADPRFLRNRIRPLVRELGAASQLAAVASQARHAWDFLEKVIDEVEREIVTTAPDATRFLRLPEDRWLRQALLHRHIARLDSGSSREVGSRDLERLADACDTLTRVSVTDSLELIRRGGEVVLRRVPVAVAPFEEALAPGFPARIDSIQTTIHIERIEGASAQQGVQTIQLPAGGEPRFLVRNRRRGDLFQPLGLPRPKKLKDFLIDRKIPVEVRDRIPLLLWNDEIVWVAGVEVSERFKVTSPHGSLYQVWLED